MNELETLQKENKKLREEIEWLKSDLELYKTLAELHESARQNREFFEEFKKTETYKRILAGNEQETSAAQPKASFFGSLKAKFNIK